MRRAHRLHLRGRDTPDPGHGTPRIPAARRELVRAVLRAAAPILRDQAEMGSCRPTLRALLRVPREHFVPARVQDLACADAALPIGHGQTISQPLIVALMTQLLRPRPDHRVLEIGTGSGYQAAVLAQAVAQVHSVERIPALASSARVRLEREHHTNVHVHLGDGHRGWPEAAPYDGIIVTAAAPRIPPALLAQLRPGGRIVIPLGPPEAVQWLTVLTHDAPPRRVLPVRFVPFLGDDGA